MPTMIRTRLGLVAPLIAVLTLSSVSAETLDLPPTNAVMSRFWMPPRQDSPVGTRRMIPPVYVPGTPRVACVIVPLALAAGCTFGGPGNWVPKEPKQDEDVQFLPEHQGYPRPVTVRLTAAAARAWIPWHPAFSTIIHPRPILPPPTHTRFSAAWPPANESVLAEWVQATAWWIIPPSRRPLWKQAR